MSGWIKFEKDLATDPRVVRVALTLASSLKMSFEGDPSYKGASSDPLAPCHGRPLPAVTVVLGALAQLWLLADTHLSEDDILPLGVHEIDQLIGIPGLCQLLPAEWLQVIDTHNVKLPNFHAHNGTTAKERALAAKRQERHRRSVSPQRDTHKRDSHGAPLPDLDQDLDQDSLGKEFKTPPTPSRSEGVQTPKRRYGKRAKNLEQLAALVTGLAKPTTT